MAEKKPPEKTEDVPVWFMTYSDVITLLMTFFILLMTFSTNEPEKFERIQISMFGGGGATGVAGAPNMEEDSLVVRQRPRSARLTLRGAEMASEQDGPGSQALDKGLAGLDGPQQFDPHRSYSIDMPLAEMFDSQGQLTLEARGHLHRAGQRIKRNGLRAALRAAPDKLDRCLEAAEFMLQAAKLQPWDIGVGAVLDPSLRDMMRLELNQMGEER